MSDTTQVHAAESSSGGSESLKAFRAILAAEAAAGIAHPKSVDTAALLKSEGAASAKTGIEARAAERKLVNGRVRVTLGGGTVIMGKMLDVSMLGASLMLEDLLAVRKTCTLDCDIFHSGKRYVFSVPALSVHAVLVSGKGFKVGFQFGPRTPAATQTLEDLLR